MAKLTVSRGSTMIGSWFIAEKRLIIGRAEGVDVKLENQAVSKQHAAIEVIGADHMLVDLNSSNGTFINGTKIARQLLRHGDTIEILDFQIRYVDHRSVVGGVEGDRTMIFHGTEDAQLAPVAAGKAPATEARSVEIVLPIAVLKSASAARAGPVGLERAITPLGDRDKDYAAIFRRPAGFSIARVSGRPPRINGKPLGEGWQPLREGAVIEIGGEKFEFRSTGKVEEHS